MLNEMNRKSESMRKMNKLLASWKLASASAPAAEEEGRKAEWMNVLSLKKKAATKTKTIKPSCYFWHKGNKKINKAARQLVSQSVSQWAHMTTPRRQTTCSAQRKVITRLHCVMRICADSVGLKKFICQAEMAPKVQNDPPETPADLHNTLA